VFRIDPRTGDLTSGNIAQIPALSAKGAARANKLCQS